MVRHDFNSLRLLAKHAGKRMLPVISVMLLANASEARSADREAAGQDMPASTNPAPSRAASVARSGTFLSAGPADSFTPYCLDKGRIPAIRCQLALAQKSEDLARIEKLAQDMQQEYGARAGEPDEPAKRHPLDPSSQTLRPDQIRTAYRPYIKQIARNSWWLSRPAPAELDHPLRYLASIITGSIAAREAGAESPEKLLEIAEGAGDYLLWAQAQGGHGLFPFPAARGKKGRPFEVAERFLRLTGKLEGLPEVVRNGWIIDDLGNGDLQFDNGLCGVAMLDLYRATGKDKYRQSAIAAADWAMAQPAVPNWNYNSFSIHLLAGVYAATGDQQYLQQAKLKARTGIYPGQIQAGANQGRWMDPHNARLVYHYLIIRGLGSLVAVLPESDPDLPKAVDVLSKALTVRNTEIISQGIANPGTVLEVLSHLQLLFPASSHRLPDPGRAEAFDRLARHVGSQLAAGQLPVEPAALGLFLKAFKMHGN